MRRIALALALLAPLAAMAQTAQPVSTAQASGMGGAHNFIARFEAANTTHDGHLTLAQAQAGGLHVIVKHFSDIDTAHKGYVTLADIKAWHQAHKKPAAGQ